MPELQTLCVFLGGVCAASHCGFPQDCQGMQDTDAHRNQIRKFPYNP